MIKLVYTMRHRDGTTREEFQRYSREHHALLVKRHAETLQIRRYVQVHARATGMDEAVAAARGSEPRVYDGVAELWWDSVDQLVAAFSSDAGVAAGNELVEDERRFTNLPRSPLWVGEEYVVIP
ncbi:MAG: EthD domain-containing protein [Solirubrobacteraceae bacterium]